MAGACTHGVTTYRPRACARPPHFLRPVQTSILEFHVGYRLSGADLPPALARAAALGSGVASAAAGATAAVAATTAGTVGVDAPGTTGCVLGIIGIATGDLTAGVSASACIGAGASVVAGTCVFESLSLGVYTRARSPHAPS